MHVHSHHILIQSYSNIDTDELLWVYVGYVTMVRIESHLMLPSSGNNTKLHDFAVWCAVYDSDIQLI